MSAQRVVLIAVVFEGSLLVLAAGVGLLLGRSPLDQLQLGWSGVAWGIIATLPLLAGLSWCLSSDWPPLRDLLRTIDETVVPLFSKCTTVDIVVISIFAALGEEVLFRGLIQPSLATIVGPVMALLITSLLFGLAHSISLTYAVVAGIIGAYLGWLVLTFDNLLVPIVVHALYDFGAILHLSRRPSGGTPDESLMP